MKENSIEILTRKRIKIDIGIILLVVGIILIILGEYSKQNGLDGLIYASEFELVMFYVGILLNTLGSITILCSIVIIVFGLNNALTTRVKDSKKERSLQNGKVFLAVGIFILISGVFLFIILTSLNFFSYSKYSILFEYLIPFLLPIIGIVIFLCSIVIIVIGPKKNILTTGSEDSKKERSFRNEIVFLAVEIFILISGVVLFIIFISLNPISYYNYNLFNSHILLPIFVVVIFLCSIVIIVTGPKKNTLTTGTKDSKKERSSLLGKILFIVGIIMFVGGTICIEYYKLTKQGEHSSGFEHMMNGVGHYLVFFGIIIILCSIPILILVRKSDALVTEVKVSKNVRSLRNGKIFLAIGISFLIMEFLIYRIYNSLYPYGSLLYIYDPVLGSGKFLTTFGIIIITYSIIKLIFAYDM